MSKRYLILLRNFLVLLITSIFLTASSYAVVTHRNVSLDPLKEYATIGDGSIVNLPCYSPDSDWQSSAPVLPESRGLPFNYNFWNPCHGRQILRDGLLLDLAFWFAICLCAYTFYAARTTKTPRKPTDKTR